MARIFITGISGYIASLFARTLLAQDPEVRILGLDIREPSLSHPRLEFIRQDIREPVTETLAQREIDTIVHTAWVLAPDHDEARMADINVNGCLNILKAAKALSVSQVLYTSSTTAYGFYPDNDIPLTEDSPLRGNADFTYARNKRQMEPVFKAFARDNPEICVTVLRPCYVAGPGLDNPLSDHLKKSFVPLIRSTAPFQYVHEDDLVRVMIMSLEQRLSGIFNVAPEGTLEFDEMVRMLGNVPVRLPDGLVRLFNGLAWKLKLSAVTQFPNAALNLMRHPWIASSDKLVRTTGFEFQYDTRAAFQSFARHHLKRKRP